MSETIRRISLLGNPNIGKSSLFNQLTGLHQKVGNFAGVTIEKKTGHFQHKNIHFEITDLPGSYSLVPKSPDESVVFKTILNLLDQETIFLFVADASNLTRNLLFFSQLADLKKPMVLAITMDDVARERGISFETNRLAELIGCPVVIVNGRTGEGIDHLKNELGNARIPVFQLYQGNKDTLDLPYREWLDWVSNLEKENSEEVAKRELAQARETAQRYKVLRQKLNPLIHSEESLKRDAGYRFDAIALHSVWGYLLMLLVLLLVFEGLFEIASYPMDWMETGLALGSEWVGSLLPDGLLKSFLVSGILAGIQGVVIFIPQIAVLFALIGLLEQSGYMARVMLLLDRFMARLGLSGKAIIPLVSGVACAVPAIMATRNMTSGRERLIAIFVTPLMSCSARLPVFTLLIAMLISEKAQWNHIPLQGLVLFGLYLIGLLGAVASAWILHRFLPGRQSEGAFLLEVPPYQLPNWKNLAITVYQKSWSFVWEAGKIILAISIILWFLAGFGPGDSLETAAREARKEALEQQLNEEETQNLVDSRRLEYSYAGRAGQWIEPMIEPMGFDWKIGVALISSFAAREVFVGTMSVLYASGSEGEPEMLKTRMLNARNPKTGSPVFTPAVILSLLVFYIFAMQCMSTLAVSYRETGSWKWPVFQLIYMTGLAVGSSTLLFQLFK